MSADGIEKIGNNRASIEELDLSTEMPNFLSPFGNLRTVSMRRINTLLPNSMQHMTNFVSFEGDFLYGPQLS